MTHERPTPYTAPDPELAAYQRAVELAKAQLAEKDRAIAALQSELEAARAVVAVARAMQEIGDAPFMDELDAYDAIAKAPSVPCGFTGRLLSDDSTPA